MNTNTINQQAKPTLVLMMGGGGSGKSFIVKRDYADWKILDCDSIKAEHPDYDPKAPSIVHEWSSQECLRRVHSAIGSGESFVFDSTGANAEKLISLANMAHAAGFQVEACYVRCPLSTALARNAARERTVPESEIVAAHSRIAISFELVSGYVDNVRIVNNG